MMSVFSIVIPARNEEQNIADTINAIRSTLIHENINFEIVVVNDGSSDQTYSIVQQLNLKDNRIKIVNNPFSNGIGHAIRYGLECFSGDYVIIAMADASDEPKDILGYIHEFQKGYDCCFGSRWISKGLVENYPQHKLVLNRFVNWCISFLFQINYADVTNAFKGYSRKAIKGISPILSRHFNITVELPLKAIVRGYKFSIIPTRWYGRKKGKSSLKLKEMGSRYLFIIIYIFLEKILCGNDYKRNDL